MKKTRQKRRQRGKGANLPTNDTAKDTTFPFGYGCEAAALALLAIAVMAIYSNTLTCPFIFDDRHNIQNNPHIRLTRLSSEGLKRAGFESPCANRPVANISFALNYYFHGYHIFGYHLVNIIIHITTGIWLYYFFKTTLNTPVLRSRYGSCKWVGLFATAIWLIHPIQTQSVTYIVQRMNSMAAMFYVMSLFFYAKARLSVKGRKRLALFSGCIIAGILAMGSKEIAGTLPLFIFLYEWYFFQDLRVSWLKRHALVFIGLLAFFACAVFLFLGFDPVESIQYTYRTRDFTLPQRVMTQFRVVIYYLSLIIFPHPSRLNLDYDFPLSYTLTDPITTLFSLVTIVSLIALVCYMAKKDPLISFCLLWFLGNLVIESSVIGLEMVFEHRTYLPSMLIILMAVSLIHRSVRAKWLRTVVLCSLVIVCAVWTYERNRVWRDDITLWRDCIDKSPKKARPRYNLGYALASRGDMDRAVNNYLMALRINPDYAKAHNNLGHALARQGKISAAINHFSQAVRIEPLFPDPRFNLGIVLASQGDYAEAIKHFSATLGINPNHAEAHYNLGIVLANQGKVEQAIAHYQKATLLNPSYAEAHYNLGISLASQGDLEGAVRHYSQAVLAKPDFSKAHHNLAMALVKQGRLQEAISHFHEALRIDPDYDRAHYNLGVALESQGDYKGAIRHYSKALLLSPNSPEVRRNLDRAMRLAE